jgi:large repetitive protein
VFSEYRARDAFSGRDAEASMGLRNRFAISKGLLANTSFERVTPLVGQASGTAFAATGAIEWTKPALSKTTARLEWRTSPTGDNLLGSFGYARKLSRDWSLLSRTLWDQVMSSAMRGRSQVGLAWRQTDRNRVNALFRIENRLDQTDALGQPTSRTMSNVAAAVVNIQSTPRLTFSTRYAAKLASDRLDAVTTKSSAHLLMARTIYDVSKRLDVGFIGSVLGNGGFNSRRYGAGAELGVIVMRNLRLAGGYNLFGFTDRDFASLGYTQRGAYLEFGFKFDESLFGKGGAAQGASR